MHIIKKYANRKLYHTSRKEYITLEGIARLIRAGGQVQVRDNQTGDDITAHILAQVVLHISEQRGAALPTSLLMSLIQLGSGALESVRHALVASLTEHDCIAAELSRRLHHLCSDGSLSAPEAERLQRLLLRSDVAQAPDASVLTQQIDIPSRHDIVQLQTQVEQLAAAVEQLLQSGKSGVAKP